LTVCLTDLPKSAAIFARSGAKKLVADSVPFAKYTKTLIPKNAKTNTTINQVVQLKFKKKLKKSENEEDEDEDEDKNEDGDEKDDGDEEDEYFSKPGTIGSKC
jgi:hypothetical protein